MNPLWIPPWPSIEPARLRSPHGDTTYGASAESQLLAGIMGHNLCLDIFGGPSDEEQAAGLQPHGEASIVPYRIEPPPRELDDGRDAARGAAPGRAATSSLRRTVPCGSSKRSRTSSATDRPVGWTSTSRSGRRSSRTASPSSARRPRDRRCFESAFGPADYLVPARRVRLAIARRASDGGARGSADLTPRARRPARTPRTSWIRDEPHAFFVAFSPRLRLAFGYVWKQADFPWMGIWEENRSRLHAPWNGQTVTRGMEFGVSPFPESRRQMIERGRLFGVPAYRWIPATNPGRGRILDRVPRGRAGSRGTAIGRPAEAGSTWCLPLGCAYS